MVWRKRICPNPFTPFSVFFHSGNSSSNKFYSNSLFIFTVSTEQEVEHPMIKQDAIQMNSDGYPRGSFPIAKCMNLGTNKSDAYNFHPPYFSKNFSRSAVHLRTAYNKAVKHKTVLSPLDFAAHDAILPFPKTSSSHSLVKLFLYLSQRYKINSK